MLARQNFFFIFEGEEGGAIINPTIAVLWLDLNSSSTPVMSESSHSMLISPLPINSLLYFLQFQMSFEEKSLINSKFGDIKKWR